MGGAIGGAGKTDLEDLEYTILTICSKPKDKRIIMNFRSWTPVCRLVLQCYIWVSSFKYLK